MDELKKAIKYNGTKLRSTGFGEGTAERGLFVRNKKTGKYEKVDKKPKAIPESVGPYIVKDEILDGIESPLTGQKYYSYSAYKQHLKENGYRISGEKPKMTHYGVPKANLDEIREDAAKALNDLKWGNVPLTEKEKAENEKELREWKRRHH